MIILKPNNQMCSTATISLFLLFFFSLSSAQLINDTAILTHFRSQTDSHSLLLTNWTSSNACSTAWLGVKCTNGRVTSLSLPSFNLRGPIDSLAHLDQLRLLNLQNNRLNSTLSSITNCSNLKLIYLSKNDLYGEIPLNIGDLKRLHRLDLSSNNLHGQIPNGFFNLTRLVTLRLQNNVLSGKIPDYSSVLPYLEEINLSNNQFNGEIPNGMVKKFGVGSFSGNVELCGSNSLPACSIQSSPSSNTTTQTVVSSTPSSLPPPTRKRVRDESQKGLSTGAIVALVVGNVVVLLLIILFLVGYLFGRRSKSSAGYGEKKVYASNAGGENEGDRSKLVFFDKSKVFGLEELLRASAEMLGKGNLGTVYKAELDDGYLVAVKRLKDANPCARKDFEHYMDVIGKLRHSNIVSLKAFYYAKDEKLLVYDYLPNGSLHFLLHGNRGPGRIPLDWTTRIGIVLGAARGLVQIHEYNASNIPHGNVKSSNVLVDRNGVACISDFGLALLLNPVHATARLGGYIAPEQSITKKLSQKADVYSFGVLILEILTGRAPAQCPPNTQRIEDEEGVDLPKWVHSMVDDEWTAEVFDAELLRYKNIEEELVAMLHVGLACVAEQADKRPRMSEVVKMVEDIRVVQSPLGDDFDLSRSSLSPSNATTEDARASC